MNKLKPAFEKLKDMNDKALTDIYAGLVVALIVAIISVFTQLGWIGLVVVVIAVVLFLTIFIFRIQPNSTAKPLKAKTGIVLNNLPARGHFTGREYEKKRLFEGLCTNYPVICIAGESGIGKTSLAREIGWLIKDDGKLFEYIVWIEDHNGDLTSIELYQTIINVWGLYDLNQLSRSDLRIQVMRLLQEKSTAIFIDNFDTVADREIEEFIRRVPAPTSKVIVTSKRKKDSPEYWLVELRGMTKDDCLSVAQLEMNRSGRSNLNDSAKTTIRDIVDLAGGSPYRIRILIGRFALGIPLLDAGNQSNFQLLEPWWVSLQNEPITKKTIMAISLFQNNPTRNELKYVAGLGDDDIAEGIKNLDRTLFIETKYSEEEKIQKYEVHAHTKAFVTHKMLGGEADAAELLDRMTLWIEEYAEKNGGWRNWDGYKKLNEQFQTMKMIFEWISNNANQDHKCRAVKIWRLIDHFLSVRANMDEYIHVGNLVLKCAKDLNDAGSITDVNVEVLGWAYMTKARRATVDESERNHLMQSAEALILDGLNVYKQSGNLTGMGLANRYLGMISKLRGDYKNAEMYLKQSLVNFEATRGLDNLGIVLGDLGDLSLQQNEFHAAIEYHRRRLIFAEAMKDLEGVSVALYNLGNLSRIIGQDGRAIGYYNDSLKAAKDASRNDIVGATQYHLAKILRKKWEIKEALKLALGARECFESSTGNVSDELLSLIVQLEQLSSKWRKPLGRLEISLKKTLFALKLKFQRK